MSIVPEEAIAQHLVKCSDGKVKAVADLVRKLETLRALEADEAVELSSAQPHRVDRVVAFDRKASTGSNALLAKPVGRLRNASCSRSRRRGRPDCRMSRTVPP